MRITEKSAWLSVTLLCASIQLARIVLPQLASLPPFPCIQMFALSTIFSIALCASVISGGFYGKDDRMWRTGAPSPSGGRKRPEILEYKAYYRTQRRVALLFSLIIWTILVLSLGYDLIEAGMACVLLPLSLIGPALYLRDWIKGRKD